MVFTESYTNKNEIMKIIKTNEKWNRNSGRNLM